MHFVISTKDQIKKKKISFSFFFHFPTFCVYEGSHRWMSMFIYRPNVNVKCLSWLLVASFTGTGSHCTQISSIPKDGKPRDGHVTTNSTMQF